ncbi:hypothetical protein [Corallococcus carmarthensis]|uniref:Lipoprotein n=1 Tax=Corallococcus carmarthensis TaxID=2316728 RepID=A0A3A8K8M0_9BACT|nr:hypothetical protein [Corallococcus carmarthensis]NOK16516.1 hypothetical protein [Corallococcus carmarthensis]RKG98133.1 hypothetical protein D7X32_30570 [Corallococcus carmarthensis]
MRMAIMAGLMATGLLAGCGGTEVQPDEQQTLATREDALPACGGKAFSRFYYSEPEMINEVGGWECDCSSSSAYVWGRTTAYHQDIGVTYCF